MAAHTSTLAFLRLGRRKPAAETSLPAVGADRPPRLLLKFGIYAGIALVVAAVAGTWLASRKARVRAERDVWADARYTADQLGRDDLARTSLGGPVSGDTLAELDVLFGRTALQRGVVRVTLFSRTGIVTYSTDHTLIGQRPYDLADVQEALTGAEVHAARRSPPDPLASARSLRQRRWHR